MSIPRGNQQFSGPRGTESGTLGDDSADNRQPADPELAAVVECWPQLPAALRAGILAMVKATAIPGI